MIFLRGTTPAITGYPRVDGLSSPLQRPTSPEVRVSTASTAWPNETAGWTVAAVDALDVAVTTSASEGAEDLFLATTLVVVGRTYLLVDVDASFVVTIESKDAQRVYLGEPLRRPVSDAARLVGWALTSALTAPQTSTVGAAIVQWRCLVGGVQVSWTQAVRITRRLPVIPLTSSELVRAYPEIRSLHARMDDTLEDLIATAWTHIVLPRVQRRGTHPEDIINAEVLTPLLAMACMLHVARMSRKPEDGAYAARWQAEFDRLLDNTVASVLWHVEAQDTPSIPLEPSTGQRATRFTRLVR